MSIITDRIVNAYLETLLRSETLSACDEDGNPTSITIPEDAPGPYAGDTFEDGAPLDSCLDASDLPDLAPKVVAEAREDLEGFGSYVEETLGFDPFEVFDAGQVARDFCLSRNGHCAGFFNGDYVWAGRKNEADALQDAAETFGSVGLSVRVRNGTLHIE